MLNLPRHTEVACNQVNHDLCGSEDAPVCTNWLRTTSKFEDPKRRFKSIGPSLSRQIFATLETVVPDGGNRAALVMPVCGSRELDTTWLLDPAAWKWQEQTKRKKRGNPRGEERETMTDSATEPSRAWRRSSWTCWWVSAVLSCAHWVQPIAKFSLLWRSPLRTDFPVALWKFIVYSHGVQKL